MSVIRSAASMTRFGRLVVMLAVLLCARSISAAVRAASSTPALAQQMESVPLSPGCNNVSLTWLTGTPTTTIAAAVVPPEALQAIWRFDSRTQTFAGFTAQWTELSDLTAVSQLDPVFICVASAATLWRPQPLWSGSAPASLTVTATPAPHVPPSMGPPVTTPPAIDPARVVLTQAEVGGYLPNMQQLDVTSLADLFTPLERSRLSSTDMTVLDAGRGTGNVFWGSKPNSPDNPLLVSFVSVYPTERDAQAAMEALRKMFTGAATARKPVDDPNASIARVLDAQLSQWDSALDYATLNNYGLRKDTNQAMWEYSRGWRRGRIIHYQVYVESPTVDPSQYGNWWLQLQDSKTPSPQ